MMGPLQEGSARDWDWLLDVNLRGITYGTEAFLPRMLAQQGERHIVNTASFSGLVALPGVGIYTTTKFAVVGFSEVLRLHVQDDRYWVSLKKDARSPVIRSTLRQEGSKIDITIPYLG